MKKVLFVMHSLGYGGAERSLVNLLLELPADRYQIDLLLFQKKGDFIQQLPPWIRILDTPAAIKGLYAPVRNAGKYAFTKVFGTACSRLVRRTRKARSAFRWRNFYAGKIETLPETYDVAAAYVGSEILYFVKDRVKADKKLVWIHNDYRTAGYSSEDDRPYLQDMDSIVSVSTECVDVLREVFPEFRDKIHYVENITSSAVIRKQADQFFPAEYAENGCNILSVGRLWPQKGFDMAIDAARILKDKGLRFRWFVVGDGYLRKKLRKQIRIKDLEHEFVLLGTRKNPYPYIKNCTVLVQSSRYEGKSVALDEAKILCAPVVTTNYPTAQDQILHGKEGIITEMSPEGIAEGVLEMLAKEEDRQAIRDYLKEREYGNQAEAEKYCQLLDA